MLHRDGATCAEGAHAALQAWHAEWVVRQHHVMLAVLQMYCSAVAHADFPVALRGYMLLEGAAAAALRRQSLQAEVAAADFGVVLDTSTVSEGLWLGCWVKQDAEVARCVAFAIPQCWPLRTDGPNVPRGECTKCQGTFPSWRVRQVPRDIHQRGVQVPQCE